MNASNVRPSESTEEIVRMKAQEANRKRRERKAKLEEKERYERECEERAARVKAAAEERKRQEEAKKEQPRPEKEKSEGKTIKQGKIGVMCDGIEYPSINAALRGTGNEKWQEESDYRRSCWTKINRELKKNGESYHSGHKFSMI